MLILLAVRRANNRLDSASMHTCHSSNLHKATRIRWLTIAWIAAWAIFSLPWTSATRTPQWANVNPPRIRELSHIDADNVLNVLFYLPAAPLASALGWPLAVGVMAGSVLSIAAEASQLFSTDRSPDGNDVITNVAGACMGALGVGLYRRRSARKWRV